MFLKMIKVPRTSMNDCHVQDLDHVLKHPQLSVDQCRSTLDQSSIDMLINTRLTLDQHLCRMLIKR